MIERYVAPVRLLLSTLPEIARESAFALKGGTAINLFYRDMPRLSVDIDLTYLPVGDRGSSLRDIDEAFDRIAMAIAARSPRIEALCRRFAGSWSTWNGSDRPIRGSMPCSGMRSKACSGDGESARSRLALGMQVPWASRGAGESDTPFRGSFSALG